jgi:8-hydroxy-5-deazaflavin:NADPH oxidoreductase
MIPLSVTQVTYSRGPETLSDLAAEIGATAVSVPEAVRGVDLVAVTMRHGE